MNSAGFFMSSEKREKSTPSEKKFFSSEKVKYLILNYERVFNDVYSHFRINILIIFEHILGFQYEQGNFLQKREKSTPSSTFFWPFSKKFQKNFKNHFLSQKYVSTTEHLHCFKVVAQVILEIRSVQRSLETKLEEIWKN